jgi:nucleoside-diphosphate-sugar epimerase
MTRTVLILGASGRFGRHAADAFWNAGWTVRRFNRKTDDLDISAQGADVIVNGWNPPGYDQWAAELLPMTERVISAARSSGATVLQPANLYVYGTDAPRHWTAETPHAATNPLGKLRIQMEAAYAASGVQTLLLRAGDFLDDAPSGNWFDRVIAPKAAKGRLSYPGDLDAPHVWAWLPDLGRAAVLLAEMREHLGRFEDILYPGYCFSANDLADATSAVVGRPVQVKRMSWLPIQLSRPVWPLAKHLLEMRYLWSLPHEVVDRRLHELVPDFEETPIEDALRSALKHQIHPDQPMAGGTVSAVA